MNTPKPQEGIAIACDLSALTDTQREQHLIGAVKLFAHVCEVRDLADGYTLRLPDEPGILSLIADFINHERLCCAFLRFVMEVERDTIWMKLSGGDGVKQFIAGAIGGLLNDSVASAAGLR